MGLTMILFQTRTNFFTRVTVATPVTEAVEAVERLLTCAAELTRVGEARVGLLQVARAPHPTGSAVAAEVATPHRDARAAVATRVGHASRVDLRGNEMRAWCIQGPEPNVPGVTKMARQRKSRGTG